MNNNEELKKHYTQSEVAIIEFVSMLWMNATGQDHQEDVYKELIEVAELVSSRKKMD